MNYQVFEMAYSFLQKCLFLMIFLMCPFLLSLSNWLINYVHDFLPHKSNILYLPKIFCIICICNPCVKLKITHVKKIELTTKRETKCMNIRPALMLKLDFPNKCKDCDKRSSLRIQFWWTKKKKSFVKQGLTICGFNQHPRHHLQVDICCLLDNLFHLDLDRLSLWFLIFVSYINMDCTSAAFWYLSWNLSEKDTWKVGPHYL